MRTLIFATVTILVALFAQPVLAVIYDKGYGEPYAVGGKRIVFTTWYWVRPGQMDWQDETGKSVFANREVMAGAFDAHFVNIDGPWGVRLTAEPAERGKLVIEPEHPWEAKGIDLRQMLPTPEGKIMAWGTCIGEDDAVRPCYLETTDAVHWARPKLGLVEFAGNKDNNLLPRRVPGRVFIDPTAPPKERFKYARNSRLDLDIFEEHKKHRPWQVMATETDPGTVHAIFGYTSPDGLVFEKIREPLAVEVSDGDQCVYWDANLKKYVMYARSYFVGPRADGYPLKHERRHQFIGRRAVGRSESTDFREFSPSEIVIDTANDMSPTDTFYLNCHTTIPGAPDEHLMFVSRYMQADDLCAVDLYTSYDGKSWHVAPGSPLLETANFGQWDGGTIFAYPNLIERAGGDWILLYTGYNVPHKYPRGNQISDGGIAIWPKGRLMAIESQEQGGFTTPAFLAPGDKLRINALTKRVGEVRVEAADFYGQTLPGRSFEDCDPIVGDQYRVPVSWKGSDSMGVKTGEPVVLRFRMTKAKIYELDFE